MARIAGINIPNHQHAEIAQTAIFGIGRARAQAICTAAGVQGTRKIKDLTDAASWRRSAKTSGASRSKATCAVRCRCRSSG